MLGLIQEATETIPMAVWVVAATLIGVSMLKKSGKALPIVGTNMKYAAWAAGMLLHFAMRLLGLGDGDIVWATDAVSGAMEALMAQVLYKHGAGDLLKSLGFEAAAKGKKKK